MAHDIPPDPIKQRERIPGCARGSGILPLGVPGHPTPANITRMSRFADIEKSYRKLIVLEQNFKKVEKPEPELDVKKIQMMKIRKASKSPVPKPGALAVLTPDQQKMERDAKNEIAYWKTRTSPEYMRENVLRHPALVSDPNFRTDFGFTSST
jgi:hypothetical protein